MSFATGAMANAGQWSMHLLVIPLSPSLRHSPPAYHRPFHLPRQPVLRCVRCCRPTYLASSSPSSSPPPAPFSSSSFPLPRPCLCFFFLLFFSVLASPSVLHLLVAVSGPLPPPHPILLATPAHLIGGDTPRVHALHSSVGTCLAFMPCIHRWGCRAFMPCVHWWWGHAAV